MNKVYRRINWENSPSKNTPLNEENLNKMDSTIDELDNRVVRLDSEKVSEKEVSELIQDLTINEETGVVTITKKSGETKEYALDVSADASFKDLSYSDYQSGNYDTRKNYAIPDYPYSDGDASKVRFDDSTAQISADNVQTAIETLAKKAKNIRVVTANFTTGNDGTVSSGVSLDTQNYILAAYAKGYDVRVYTNASGVQGFRVSTIKSDGTLTPLSNSEVSITSIISDNSIAGGGQQ